MNFRISADIRRTRVAPVVMILLALFTTTAGAQTKNENAPTIIIIVRHAEKAVSESTDPPLSDAGRKRAEELARVAEDAGVTAIYTTQFKRTTETAQPVAARSGASANVVEISKENAAGYPAALAKRVLAKHAGGTVLVIGHSNTVPQLVEAFGGKLPPAIDDKTEFDRLFVVIVPKSGAVKTIKARY